MKWSAIIALHASPSFGVSLRIGYSTSPSIDSPRRPPSATPLTGLIMRGSRVHYYNARCLAEWWTLPAFCGCELPDSCGKTGQALGIRSPAAATLDSTSDVPWIIFRSLLQASVCTLFMTPGTYFVCVSWSTSLAGVVVSRAVLPLHVVCGGLRLTPQSPSFKWDVDHFTPSPSTTTLPWQPTPLTMADYNALGLTFRSEPAALNLNEVDWDSVTVVSLQSIPDLDHKILSFPSRLFAFGRWSAGAPGRASSSALRKAGILWRARCVLSFLGSQNPLPQT